MHFAMDASNTRTAASLDRQRRKQTLSSQCGHKPFPHIQLPQMTLSTMSAEVGVVAWLLQSTDDVQIFAVQAAHSPVELLKVEAVLFSSELSPTPFHFHVLGYFVAGRQKVINDRGNGYCRTNPSTSPLKIACLAENSCSADQKDEAEEPFQVPVKLDMAIVEFNRVINIQACFVMSAAIVHFLIHLTGSRGRLRWGVTVHRYLCFVFYITLTHEDSLIWIEVLGSAEILACESSPFLDSGSNVSRLLCSQLMAREVTP